MASFEISLKWLCYAAPVFNREIYEVTVLETCPPNTPVIRLKVTDRDVGKNALVSLEIVGGNEGGEFRVNAETGVLYTSVALDADRQQNGVTKGECVERSGGKGTSKLQHKIKSNKTYCWNE